MHTKTKARLIASFKIWIVIYPSITLFLYLFGQPLSAVEGVYACGDNSARMRAVASAVAMGTMAGAAVNKEIIFEEF